MEDLWKLREMGYRLGELGDRAEYDLMIRRFREEERRSNLRNLLYNDANLEQDDPPGEDN